ncbi:transglycosylase domain-containing protein [Actinoallomurus sp. NPDC050550]|uniref:transglycosylase domain-containing protein n=1 Tax=Actinoallomurus sp. NPDC050550 TaxID=3154937 RepID=UPI0033DB2739
MGVAYAMTPVPKVNSSTLDQGTTIYYSDGKTVLGVMGTSRRIVTLGQMSSSIKNAVLAAEDRKFYHEAAISPTGIGRAVINNLSGGDTQGGSTITQQYVKNAYLNQERTFTRKFKELFVSIKIGKQKTKDQILQDYLNTIWFGNGANGIEAAAKVYYNTKAQDLTVPQAAMLAANVKWPGHYDPSSSGPRLQDTIARYNWVLDGEVKMGVLPQAEAAKYMNHPPKFKIRKATSGGGDKQKEYLLERVRQSLASMKIDQAKIETGGLKVYTSWDPGLQEKAAAVVKQRLQGMPSDTRVGVVTIDAKNGEVKAAYGGKDFTKRAVDDAYFSTAQIGSSIKPFVLAAAVKEGIGIKSMMSAKGPIWVNTSGDVVPPHSPASAQFSNDEGSTDKVVDLVEATAESYNTVYVPLGFKAKWQNVFKTAEDAGLPKTALQRGHPGEGGFFLGQSDMRPLDLATGYTTLANDGKFIVPHSIRKVVDSQHKVIMESKTDGQQVIDQDVIKDVQFAMQAVVKRGTGVNAQLAGHEVAGKTGTTNDNMSAWFSGFTPPTTGSKPKQYVTTVGMWRYVDKVTKGKHKHDGYFKKLQNVGGYGHINGGDLPAKIWHDYMSQALDGMTTGSFPPPAYAGDKQLFATPSPTATTPTPSPTPTCQDGQIPEIDHCKPGKTQGPGGPPNPKYCKHHPMDPRCAGNGNQSPTPNPTDTCKNFMGCPSNPANPGGPPNGQDRAARPFKE